MSSKHVVGHCKLVRDGWEMAGWLALAISNDFGCDFGSLRDGRDMAGRWLEGTPIVFKHPIQQQTPVQYNTPILYKQNQHQMARWLVVVISNTSGVHLHRREMAGRWLGDGWGIALAISKDCGCNSRSLHGDL